MISLREEEHKYFNEIPYKKGVELFKKGATAVEIQDENGEHKVVKDLSHFKSIYRLLSQIVIITDVVEVK